MSEECQTATVETCPSWCVADHSDYSSAARARGDLILHVGETDGVRGFTVQIGGDDAEEFGVQRMQQVDPEGRIQRDGYYFGSHFVTTGEAESLLMRTLRAIEAYKAASPKAIETLQMMADVTGAPFDPSAVQTELDAREAATAIGKALGGALS